MAVNYDIYGRPEQWIDTSFNRYITNKNKVAYFASGQSRLQNGVSQNKLSYDRPIDNSLSYCGLGTESALSHIGYIYKQSGTYAVRDWQDSTVTNFAFFQQNSTEVYMSPSPNNCYFEDSTIYKTLAWQANRNSDNKNQYLQPYTLINPHNQVLCIYIRACNNSITDFKDVPMSTYISSYKTSHPKIVNVYLMTFFNNQAWTTANPVRTLSGDTENSLNANQLTFSYGRLDNYKCEGKNFDIYSYYLNNCTIMGSSSFSDVTKYDDKMLFVMATENCKNHVGIYTTGGDNDYLNVYIEYFEGIEEEILKTVACFGLYFTPNETVAKTGKLTNNDMYIGILNAQGVGHGDYFRGADTVRAPQAQTDFTDMHSSGYDPTLPYIDYDTSSHYGTASYYNFNKMYSITGAQVQRLAQILSTAMSVKPASMSESDYSTGTFLTNNPIDCIVSLRKYPIVSTSSSESIHDIYFGGYKSSLTAPYANNVQIINYSFTGEKAFISAFGGSFLDREPYTSAELYVPFCGNVKLKADEWIDHALTVRLIVDYLTGSCTAYIERDGIPRITISGDIGIDVPVTGVQSQTLANTIMRNNANLRSAQISVVQSASGAAISGTGDNPLQLVSSAINLVNRAGNIEKALNNRDIASYALHHTEIPYKSVSSGDPVTSGYGEWRCRLSITRPVLSPDFDPETYGKTIGYACLKQGRVSDFTGLTVGTIDLTGINAPAEVKNMIQTAFSKGVYL